MQIFNKKGVFSILFLSEKTRTDTFFIENSSKCTTGVRNLFPIVREVNEMIGDEEG